MRYSFLLLALLVPIASFAHAGKLNADSCHNNKKTGQYECHAIKVKEAKQTTKTLAKISAKGNYNCADFSSQSDAQKIFIKAGGPKLDSYDLDRDRDGKACEKLK